MRSLLIGFLLAVVPGQSALAGGHVQSQPWIRVAIVTGLSSLTISVSGPSRIHELEASGVLTSFDTGQTFVFERSGAQVRLTGPGGTTSDGFTIVCSDESGRLSVNGRSYRRMVRIVIWNGGLACVNVLPMEEYLWGVVPCEVPYSWPPEALRAQAVAARTYALRSLEQYPDRPFDVYSGVTDQVYEGCGVERETTTSACIDTVGEICSFNGTPIIAYFHSAAGGWTAGGEEMFGRDLPYLTAVPSRDASVHRWTYSVSAGELGSALRRLGHDVGTIQRIWVHKFSAEGRADEIKVVHSRGVLLVSAADIRRALRPANIQSTYFTVEGQPAPEIPQESEVALSLDRMLPSISFEDLMSAHPDALVAFPQAIELGHCRVLTAYGIETPERYIVLGADESREYIDGCIWVADPVRAGELSSALLGAGEAPVDDVIAHGGDGRIVEDPGGNVGIPDNGSLTFVGVGMGHGVGMSQHGARILAESGWTYDRILKHFYTGVQIERFW